jgi:cell division protein FtsB
MSRCPLIPWLLLGLCLVLILWQRNAIGAARRAQADLVAAKERAAQLAAENAELSRPRLAAGTNSFDDTTELLRLRNEVRQLRAVPQEVARLRAANDQLAAEIKSGSAAGELTEMEGYQPKESWNDSGLGSPEATVQTFFRAVRDQDVARLLQCLSEPGTLALDLRLDAKTGQLRPSSVGALQTLGLVQGYRIEARNSAAPEQVALSLRAKTGGTVIVLVLRKFGEDWKIDR